MSVSAYFLLQLKTNDSAYSDARVRFALFFFFYVCACVPFCHAITIGLELTIAMPSFDANLWHDPAVGIHATGSARIAVSFDIIH